MLHNIRIILVAPSHPGNIGAAARAMKNMGFSRLYLVTPRQFPAREANELAAGADDILANAVVTDALSDALQGCHLILATSARPRDLDLPGLTPHNAAHLVAKHSTSTEIAILFGREHAGLTNEELMHAHYHIHIPTNPDFSSLNLAQAVQVVVYELRQAMLATTSISSEQKDLASHDEFEAFMIHLREVLIDIDFLQPTRPGRLMARLRRLFNRSQLEKTELNILRGILTHLKQHRGAIHGD